jgi:putative flippase GtrA
MRHPGQLAPTDDADNGKAARRALDLGHSRRLSRRHRVASAGTRTARRDDTEIGIGVDVLYREIGKFGAIGALAYLLDTYLYNLLRVGIWPVTEAPLGHKTVLCKVISTSVATVAAWLGNRYWTFRHRHRPTARAEVLLFGVVNAGGLLMAAGCLVVSHYLLGLTSPLADNISANAVGLVLGTLFRFWAYRQFVFTDRRDRSPLAPLAPAPAAVSRGRRAA